MNRANATRNVTLTNRAGWHIRPVSQVARLANKFQANVELVRDRQRANAKSMIEMLSLGGRQGDEFLIEATGDDAEAAVEALAELFAVRFHEDDMEG